MNIIDLINHIGIENIDVQNLRESLSNIKKDGNDHKVEFYTDKLTASDVATGSGKIGLVMWFDRGLADGIDE